jgi:hypothetical protein
MLGLRWGELGIGSTIYAGLKEIEYPTVQGVRLAHVASLCTYYPTLELGHMQPAVGGVMQITGANVTAFVQAVRDGSVERRISFIMDDEECYGLAQSGDITANRCINYNARGQVTRIHQVTFSFPLTRSIIYQASDDSVMWGS